MVARFQIRCPRLLSPARAAVELRLGKPAAPRRQAYTGSSQLPHSIDAFLVGQLGSEGAAYAADAHARFLARYGLSADDVPLLEVTGSATRAFRIAATP